MLWIDAKILKIALPSWLRSSYSKGSRDRLGLPSSLLRSEKETKGGDEQGRVAPRSRTCPFGHAARHVSNSPQGGTLSGSQSVVGADTVPEDGYDVRGRIQTNCTSWHPSRFLPERWPQPGSPGSRRPEPLIPQDARFMFQSVFATYA